jgi:hypothetical protein
MSASGRRILEWAAALASPEQAEVRLLHAVAPAADAPQQAAVPGTPELALDELFSLARRLPRRTRVSAAVCCGDPGEEILRHARLTGADLIAIGLMSEDGGVSTLTCRVAGAAGIPVLAVGRHDGAHASAIGPDVKRVFCQRGEASAGAERYACAFADRTGAELAYVADAAPSGSSADLAIVPLPDSAPGLARTLRRFAAARGPVLLVPPTWAARGDDRSRRLGA